MPSFWMYGLLSSLSFVCNRNTHYSTQEKTSSFQNSNPHQALYENGGLRGPAVNGFGCEFNYMEKELKNPAHMRSNMIRRFGNQPPTPAVQDSGSPPQWF